MLHVKESFEENRPLNDYGCKEEGEPSRTVSIFSEECHEKTESDEYHDMNVLEIWKTKKLQFNWFRFESCPRNAYACQVQSNKYINNYDYHFAEFRSKEAEKVFNSLKKPCFCVIFLPTYPPKILTNQSGTMNDYIPWVLWKTIGASTLCRSGLLKLQYTLHCVDLIGRAPIKLESEVTFFSSTREGYNM